MPTRRDEPWRYTPVEELAALLSTAVHPRTSFGLAAAQIDIMAGDHGGPRIVFVNGTFAPGPSSRREEPGADVRALSEIGRTSAPGPALEPDRLDGFVALNALAGEDGAVITVGADHAATAPIHVVHVAVPDLDDCLLTHPSTVVKIEAGACATIIESYVGFTGAALTNATTVIDVHDSAGCTYHRVQTETPTASHLGYVRIRAGHDASVNCTSFTIGASTSRVAIDAGLLGDRSRIDLAGLYVPDRDDTHDQVITAEHHGSHTCSNQRFNGVMNDRARGSFTGQVIVQPGTIDTDAHQVNHSLLLTDTAESDTRPWLEILADDVRCTHGATVGRLDDDAIFYLRTRGIPEMDARRMLIEGFASEIIDVVADETLRDHLRSRMRAKQQRRETDS
ncbi:Fe-S cluster assembly protein SufD [Aquihabitans daechungensis]|uniref:Fe-S cluster assembly protein SufD n=1 Tax=Aquihabitans daechungensis TaxID=1052257 RepID=UPI003BA0857A